MAKRALSKAASGKSARRAESIVGAVAPAPLPAPVRPAAEALAAFEAAVLLVQRHDYSSAANAFRKILDQFPAELAVLDRARQYLVHCERETSAVPSLQTAEDRLTGATAALNNGDDREAERLAVAVLEDDPEDDMALYLMAAIHARRRHENEVLAFLRRAIDASPEARGQARLDPDFEWLLESQAFLELTERPAGPGNRKRLRR